MTVEQFLAETALSPIHVLARRWRAHFEKTGDHVVEFETLGLL